MLNVEDWICGLQMKTKEEKRGGIYLKFRKEVFVKFPDKVELVDHVWLWYVCTIHPLLFLNLGALENSLKTANFIPYFIISSILGIH